MDQHEFANIMEKSSGLDLEFQVAHVLSDWRKYSEQLKEYRHLLGEVEDINARNDNGYTLLHMAAMRGHTHSLRELVGAGADINAQHVWTWARPLHTAMFEDRQASAIQLINLGANLNATDSEGHNALHIAASYNLSAVAQLIIEKGGDATAQNSKGDTPSNLALHPELRSRLDDALAVQQREKLIGAVEELESVQVQALRRRM